MTIRRCCMAALVSLVCEVGIAAHPGVDPTFGVAGMADMPASSLGLASPVRMDSATVTRADAGGGMSYVFASNYENYALARFDRNGQLDRSFAGSGVVEGIFSTAAPAPMVIALARSGKPLIVAGTKEYFSTILQMRRFTSSGTPDASFGSGGSATVTFPVVVTNNGTVPATPTNIVDRSGGGVFVTVGGSAVVAITDQGAVDTSFASGGFFIGRTVAFDGNAYHDIVLGVSPNGRMYVLRQTADGPRVLRFLANGSMDPLYGLTIPSPLLWYPVDSYLDAAENLVIAFSVSGITFVPTLKIYRLDGSGRLDPSFGANGTVAIDGILSNISHANPAYRLADVASDGTLLLVTRIESQAYTAPLAMRLLDRTGKLMTTFGGKGLSRVELRPIDTREMYAVNARFDESGRVIALGTGTRVGPSAIHALRLNRAFTHMATLTDVRTSSYLGGSATPKTIFEYGDNILGDGILGGDSGQPAGVLRFDAGKWSCSANVFLAYGPDRAGCYLQAQGIGQFAWTLSFAGDDFYGAIQATGPQIRIDKRVLLPFVTYLDATTLVADYATVGMRWSNPVPTSLATLAQPAGITEFTRGAQTCQTPLDMYGGASCRAIARQVGPLPWIVRYVGDPFYTSDSATLGILDVLPANKSVTVNLPNGVAQVTVAGTNAGVNADVDCGLKSWSAYQPTADYLASLPRPNAAAAVKGGAMALVTVPGCSANGALAIDVTYPFDVVPEAELWTVIGVVPPGYTPLWARLPATVNGRTVRTSVVDGSAYDGDYVPGTIAAMFVLYNTAGPAVPSEGRLYGFSAYEFGQQGVGIAAAPVKFAVTNVGSRAVNVTSVSSTNAVEFRLSDVACGVVAPGGTCRFQVSLVPASTGDRTGAIVISSDAESNPFTIALKGLGVVPPAMSRLVEYRHALFDHYFVTSIADEISKLDSGVFAGWARTGLEIPSYPVGSQGATVCRFFSAAFAPKSSHFYTASASECDTVKANSNWQFEGTVFNIGTPTADGTCPSGTVAVYRLYNNGSGGAPNHRYTTSDAARDQMLAQGWIGEGYGPAAVMMCAPGS